MIAGKTRISAGAECPVPDPDLSSGVEIKLHPVFPEDDLSVIRLFHTSQKGALGDEIDQGGNDVHEHQFVSRRQTRDNNSTPTLFFIQCSPD